MVVMYGYKRLFRFSRQPIIEVYAQVSGEFVHT
jgi:hypothetical protein